jgi:hypothetical protein
MDVNGVYALAQPLEGQDVDCLLVHAFLLLWLFAMRL